MPGLRLVDGVGGALLTGAVGLGFVWIAGSALVQSGGLSLPLSLRSDIQRSAILRELDKVLPPSGPLLNELARVDPLPGVTGSTSDIAAPEASIVNATAVGQAASSVVRVTGDACGLGVEGSGWVIAPDTIVTNAHVVAGEDNTTVQVDGDGIGLRAQLRLLDVHNDVAILHVNDLNLQALPLASGPVAGSSAAILGYPQDGPFNIQPARLGRTQETATENAYGQGPVLRSITGLRGLVRPGNSGGALIDSSGHVVGMIFAEETDAPAGRPAGFAVPAPVVASDYAKVRNSDTTVSSGSCAD
jgi:S1-C subfamily serine protease